MRLNKSVLLAILGLHNRGGKVIGIKQFCFELEEESKGNIHRSSFDTAIRTNTAVGIFRTHNIGGFGGPTTKELVLTDLGVAIATKPLPEWLYGFDENGKAVE